AGRRPGHHGLSARPARPHAALLRGLVPLLVLVVLAAVPRAARAQGDVDALAAREVARIAQLDLRRTPTPTAADFAIAADVLRIAHALAPDDEQILRLLIEAVGQGGGAPEEVTSLSRTLLALNSKDTVTQLRVISDAISRLQSVDARLAAYDNYLGPRGRSLDASVRSRLALDAALLLRERGDIEGFAERLSLAAELDSTNKDA